MLSKSQKIIIKKGENARKRRLKNEAKKDAERRKWSLWRQKRELLKKSTRLQKIKFKLKWMIWKKSERELLETAYEKYLQSIKNSE